MKRWARAFYQPNLPLGENGERVTASKAHIELSKQAAKEGMVLLKNDNHILPFAKGTKLALFGKGTFDYVKGGGGSGDVTVPYTVNLYEGFAGLGSRVQLEPASAAFYRRYVEEAYAKGGVPGMIAEPELSDDVLTTARAFTDTAVISISRYSGEGWDRKSAADIGKGRKDDEGFTATADQLFERGDFYLSAAETAMVEKVKKTFPRVVAVLNVGGMVDVTWFEKDPAIEGVLMAWQCGIEGGSAAAELLCGLDNPSGHLADTFAHRLEDYPSTAGFHASEDYVEYTDDIYVGYRYFETIPGAAEKVSYCFGYGLSYTSFAVEKMEGSEKDGVITVSAEITNTGDRAGKEVFQVYFGAPQGKLGKPARVLAGYKKTRLLQAGETQRLSVSFPVDQMASYDDLGKVAKSAYVLEKGTYTIYAGRNVRETEALSFAYTVAEDTVTKQLTSELYPTALSKRMLADGSFEELPVNPDARFNENGLGVLEKKDMKLGMSPEVPFFAGGFFLKSETAPHTLSDVAEGKVTLEALIRELSDEELVRLLGGQANTGVANTFGYGNLPAHGIPSIMTADGPAGLRIHPEVGVVTTAFPCSTALACTWDPDVCEAVGAAGGAEVKENNICVWLTPAINIHRSPMCGRNFEYYSEDPLLAGRQAGAMVRGIQSNHVAATVKHFALNNKETNRQASDSRCSERAIREIYLKAFEMIVKEAKPWSIMTSYNVINGRRSSESAELLTDILRGEWGFDGMVTTDWWTFGEHYLEAKAGNDVKMGCGLPERLTEALEKGLITRSEMEACARNILQLILRVDG